jgi:Transglutaminase-like superfamily
VPVKRPGTETSLGIQQKALLTARVWWLFFHVHYGLRKHPLPTLVERLRGTGSAEPRRWVHPVRLGHAVYRVLNVGGLRPRCLVMSLVLYRLVIDQGDQAELVIGLPERPAGHEAHAWVEIAGKSVGPPPGPSGHRELARYG